MWLKLSCLLLLLSGCVLRPPNWETPSFVLTAVPTAIYPWVDASAVTNAICFEAAFDAAGQVFVLRDEATLTAFYDGVDHSELCRHPVTRFPFDFEAGQVLVGLWNRGQGCTAQHDILGVNRDDSTHELTIRLGFSTEGDCNYELVRGFWIALEGMADYQVTIQEE